MFLLFDEKILRPAAYFDLSRIPENLELSDGVWSLNVEPLNFEPP
jgi:hypothetical protein